MKKTLFLLSLFLISFNIRSQVDIKGIYYYFEEPSNPYKDADTSNYYAIFEYHFNGDSVLIFNDSTVIFNEILSEKVLYSEKVKLGDIHFLKNVFVRVNNSPILKLQMIKEKYYIRFSLNRIRGILSICFSKYPPRYR